MEIDIKAGDLLVVGSVEYPIRKANIWASDLGTTRSHIRNATVSCSTKRSPTGDSDGFIGAATTKLSGLYCLPLDPVSGELATSEGLDTAYELKYTIIADATSFVQLFLEDVKRT